MRVLDDWIVFEGRTLFKAMVQQFGEVKLRKTPEAVQSARFTGLSIPLVNDHHDTAVLGEVRNMRYQPHKWVGDVYFNRSKLSVEQEHLLKSGQKKDLSIGYSYKLLPAGDHDQAMGLQTDIVVEHLAWVDTGRCGSACALYDAEGVRPTATETVNLMTECDELVKKLQAQDAATAALTTELELARAELATYRARERDGLVDQLLKVSKYSRDDLKDDPIETLRIKLDVLQKAKDTRTAAYPEGQDNPNPNPNETPGYNPWGSSDLSALRAKKDK